MEDIDKYLDEGATPEEREAAAEVLAGLQALRIRHTVQQAAAARQRLARARWWRRSLSLLSILLLGGGAAWWFLAPAAAVKKSLRIEEEGEADATDLEQTDESSFPLEDAPDPASSEPAEESVPSQLPPGTPQQPEPAETPTPAAEIDANIPIAAADIPPPPYGAPGSSLRGSASQSDARQLLLDQVWYTSYPLDGVTLENSPWQPVDSLLRVRAFPKAYVALQRLGQGLPSNDTLQYLQAYILLEMGQGGPAQRLLAKLTAVPASWQAQLRWYQVLAYLLANEDQAGLEIARELAATANHPYQAEAAKVLRLWNKQ